MPITLHQEAGQAVIAQREAISQAVVARDYELRPELLARYGERGRAYYLRDNNYHLDYLAQSLMAAQPALFIDYLAWAKVMLAGHNVAVEDLAHNLERLHEVLPQILPENLSRPVCEYVTAGLQQLAQMPVVLPSFLSPQEPLAKLAREYLYLDALLDGKRQSASQLILDAVASGVAVRDIYLQVFQPCQYEVGRLWQMNQISVAREHYCTAATQLIMSQLYPYLFGGERNGSTLVATCVAGDLHEIGIRMVSDIFELSGWDTYYLGANSPLPGIVQTVLENRADVLAVSATIIPHLQDVKTLIDLVRAEPECGAVKVLVGGHPFNVVPDLWQQLGADGYAGNAATAVELANRLIMPHEPKS